MARFLSSAILLTMMAVTAAIECPFEPMDNSYVSIKGNPAYTVEEIEPNMEAVFEQSSTLSCTPTVRFYRGYASGAMVPSDATKRVDGVCEQPTECTRSKESSLQAATCTELLRVRDEITSGGYTGTCRHELTNWNVNPTEWYGCVKPGTCTDPNYNKFLQRRLSPAGLRRATAQGESLKKAGVVIDSLISSSYERSKNSALQVGKAFELTEVTEVPLPLDNGVHNREDYERKAGYEPATDDDRKSDAKKIMGVRLRKWLQEEWEQKTAGGVRYAYSHGGTMQNAFGHTFDEGDCAWTKPTENTYNLDAPLDVTLSNKEFPGEMEVGTKRIDLFAVLSPEQTQKMAQCHELRKDLNDETSLSGDTTILAADENKDLEITEEEFTKFCNSLDTSKECSDLWSAILSLQAKPYWKKDTAATSFFIGEHAYFNGGWTERKYSSGGWRFPYRRTTLDTIRPTVAEMRQILAPLDQLIRASMNEKEEKAVLDCNPKEEMQEQFSGCVSAQLNYKPVPTCTRPEDDIYLSTDHPDRDVEMYTYPTSINITPVPNPMMKLAMCLVQKEHRTAGEMARKMGCELVKSEQTCSDNSYRFNSSYRDKFVFALVMTLLYNLF